MSPYEKLIVVTPAAWVARDLAATGFPVIHEIGLDAPVLDGATALWCSGAYANRLLASGIDHPLAAPGELLAQTPYDLLGRHVSSHRLDDPVLGRGVDHAFGKLESAKFSPIPAGTHRSTAAFVRKVHGALDRVGWSDLDIHSLAVQVSEPVSWLAEYRCFVAHGQVVAGSFYLGHEEDGSEVTWDSYEDAHEAPDPGSAMRFAQQVVDRLIALPGELRAEDRGAEIPGWRHPDPIPPGFTIDVGLGLNGNWTVVEYNAAWSSNPYHADPVGVLASILASQEPGHPGWAWTPDDGFARRARPLPTR